MKRELAALLGQLLLSSMAMAKPNADRSTRGENNAALLGEVLGSLESLDLAAAERALDQFGTPEAAEPVVRALRGRLDFFRGRYDLAVAELGDADEGYAHLAKAALEETRTYDQRESAHFQIRFPRGKDALLAPYALQTLETALERIGHDLGAAPSERIRVEILRDPASLARMSPLTETQIETSGTIALCKYNKLMVVSPRALLTGYTWQDTLAHELTHYLITLKSSNKTPIWLHEGIAKYEESRWRGAAGQALSPSTAGLLRERLASGTLISFERMHPSMALLPSQDDAALAFAEVFTTIEFMVEERHVSLQALLEALADGQSDDAAVALVAREPFVRLVRDWKSYLRRRPSPEAPRDLGAERKQFKGKDEARVAGEKSPSDRIDTFEIDDPRGRRLAHLGALLSSRTRNDAALVELQKAAQVVGARSPSFSNFYAKALLQAGRPSAASDALGASLLLYPDVAQTHLQLGQVGVETKQWAVAKRELLSANSIDPFDPAIHLGLLLVAQSTGDTESETIERASMEILHRD